MMELKTNQRLTEETLSTQRQREPTNIPNQSLCVLCVSAVNTFIIQTQQT